MNALAIEKTELNKILAQVSTYAATEGGKKSVLEKAPSSNLLEVKNKLKETGEGVKLLFDYGVSKVEYFAPFTDELQRAQKGASLTLGELLNVASLLRSTRIAYTSLKGVQEEEITRLPALAENLYFDENLEKDITEKIINETELSDYASEKLYELRREIRSLNERIRSRLGEYLTGKEGKYLQDGIVTMRANRYVLPVRAEYKRNVKGFIHDRSASGATFFIEPEEVLEMNNELRSITLEEKEEVARIVATLSFRVGQLSSQLLTDIEILTALDDCYACAQYAYKQRGILPQINKEGTVIIDQGRHPLIDKEQVVPVSLEMGGKTRFLLISGPNTGGKTVTLKMVGLFCMMAACGLFIPARRANIALFDEIYCDIGDAQSIEKSLSTFSSHMQNIIGILGKATSESLVLVDELGGGTDPDEGQALAKAVVSNLLKKGCHGVVTTHYTALKEFAFEKEGIENACMEFDADTLQPLYEMKIGVPGSSNALAICRRLGLQQEVLEEALDGLSPDAKKFENIVRSAEESRVLAERALQETNRLKAEWQEKIVKVDEERAQIKREREKLFFTAKTEAKRIITQRAAKAEELLEELEELFHKESLAQSDLIAARTLKNRLSDLSYTAEAEEYVHEQFPPIEKGALKVGDCVFVQSMSTQGVVQAVKADKQEAEVLCGTLRVRSKFSDLRMVKREKTAQTVSKQKKGQEKKSTEKVSVTKNVRQGVMPTMEVNVIGLTVLDAIPKVQEFLDAAVLANLEEVCIVHGMGTGRLRAGIHEFLRKEKSVASFRLGKYGEGDTGVTIVTLK